MLAVRLCARVRLILTYTYTYLHCIYIYIYCFRGLLSRLNNWKVARGAFASYENKKLHTFAFAES